MTTHLTQIRRLVLETLDVWASGLHGKEAKALASAVSREELEAAYIAVAGFALNHADHGRSAGYRRSARHTLAAARQALSWLDNPPSYKDLDDWGVRTHRETSILARS